MILVAQSFGRESEYRRVVFAILSYFAYSKRSDTQVLLFTDQPDWFRPYFEGLQVAYSPLYPAKIEAMRGEIDFLHRMKIALIEEAFITYPGENLFYIDSDTFFIADPDDLDAQVSPQKSFMHLWEYQFESLRNLPLPAGETFRAFVQLIESRIFTLSNGDKLAIDATMSSWNAGVMMFHHSHVAFIKDVYALTDQFYPETKNHACEQYAFSILLQKFTDLHPCDKVIYHYWYQIKKRIADEVFERVMGDLSRRTLAERISSVKNLCERLPSIFDTHLLSLKDNAVQAFNEKKFGRGYKWALKALTAGGFSDTSFIRDVLYHTKQMLTRK